jgi:hypothetical protein
MTEFRTPKTDQAPAFRGLLLQGEGPTALPPSFKLLEDCRRRRAPDRCEPSPQLVFHVADQFLKPLFGERVNGFPCHPSRLFQPSFQFSAIALFSHGVIPVYV